MVRLLRVCGLRWDDDGTLGAQTERRGSAGPAGGSLGGKDPTGRCAHWSGCFGRPTGHGSGPTSPPARVTRRANMRISMLAFRNRTEPSAITALAPPG